MEIVLGLTLAAAIATALFTILCFLRIRNIDRREAVTRSDLSQMLRAETELLRSSGEERARFSRQELGQTLKNFQQLTLTAFSTLREGIEVQVRSFGERLDASTKVMDQHVGAIFPEAE